MGIAVNGVSGGREIEAEMNKSQSCTLRIRKTSQVEELIPQLVSLEQHNARLKARLRAFEEKESNKDLQHRQGEDVLVRSTSGPVWPGSAQERPVTRLRRERGAAECQALNSASRLRRER